MSKHINFGKRFEEDFKNSVPDYCYVHRLRDSAQSYNNSSNTKFAWDNECDFFLYDGKSHLFYGIECKTTKSKRMDFQIDKDDESSKMIKYHQIESLTNMSKYDGIIAGFFFNFRHFEGQDNAFENTYFQNITDFNKMIKKIGKKSFNEMDIILNGAIKVHGQKKRVRYRWDIESFLKNMNSK